MKAHRVLVFVCFSVFLYSMSASAQVGVRIHYSLNNFSDWNQWARIASQVEEFFPNIMEFGVDYRLALKKVRLEFYPYLSYGQSTTDIRFTEGQLKLSQLGAGIDMRYYPMDTDGDCNCPTFSKQGDFLQKSFFVMLSAGARMYDLKTTSEVLAEGSGVAYQIAAGAGLDIGFSDFFTLTPFAQLAYGGGYRYDELSGVLDTPADFSTSLTQTILGLRLGFRFDYTGRRRR